MARGDLNIFALSCALGLASLFSVALFWREPVLLSFLLLAIAGAMIWLRKDACEVALFALCGIAGTAAEAIGIAGGAWQYGKVFAFGVPMWLPVLWGIAAIFMARCYFQIAGRSGKGK